MNKDDVVTADHIKKAVAALRAMRPAYDRILDFYEKLFLAQEASKGKATLKPPEIQEDLLAAKHKDAFPIISTADFTIDAKASEALLRQLCQFATEANEVLAQAGPKIIDALDKGTLEVSSLFSTILNDQDAYLDEVARKVDVGKAVLAFVGYHSIKPSLSLCAQQLNTYLDKEAQWEKGYCPICGNLPALSILRDEGKRFLLCGFCGHEWTSSRIFCPFCENRDQKTLHYFCSEEEKDCRVDVCNQCKKYIKTVDTREMNRPVYPSAEQVSTLHLDMLAQEQGLDSGYPLWFQT